MKTELGHHPAHSFKPAVPGKIVGLTNEVNDLCKPNRNVKHFAICDICDQVSKDMKSVSRSKANKY